MNKENRATGRTTRLCDKYIQILFENGSTGPIIDHYGSNQSNLMLADMIIRRLNGEHKGLKFEKILGKYPIISIKKEIKKKNIDISKNRGLSVTQKEVNENMQNVLVRTVIEFDKPTTYVTVQMKNGFTLRESTTCVDPNNYNEELGKEICLKRIEDKIWFLLGYDLQELNYRLNNF